MIRLNRKTEYALLALRYLSARTADDRVSVRAIAEHYSVPEMVLAKVLQKLRKGGMVVSQKGARGGYSLSRDTREIPFTDVLRLFDESTHIVECLPTTSAAQCQQEPQCDIQRPLEVLNGVILEHLENLSLAVFFASGTFTATKDLSINSAVRPAVRD